jgi:hypothetical protein
MRHDAAAQSELHFEADVVVRDLASGDASACRLAIGEPYFTLAPTGICEVLSPSIGRLDRAEKLRSMRAEVRHRGSSIRRSARSRSFVSNASAECSSTRITTTRESGR